MEFQIDDMVKKPDKNTLKEEKPKAKIGRPPIKKRKNKNISAYFTQEEYDEISAAAAELEVTLANFARQAILKRVKGSN